MIALCYYILSAFTGLTAVITAITKPDAQLAVGILAIMALQTLTIAFIKDKD
jgi:hypothetical protein